MPRSAVAGTAAPLTDLDDVFIAPGQGVSAFGALAHDFLRAETRTVDRVLSDVDEVVVDHGYPAVAPFVQGQDEERGRVPGVSQLAHYATAVTLLEILREHGVQPQAVVAQSLGESAALVAAGVLTVQDAAAGVCFLNDAYAAHPSEGGLVLVATDEVGARELIARSGAADLELAGINAPRQTLLSGGETAIAALLALDGTPGVPPMRRLPVPYLTHHSRLGAIHDDFERALRSLPNQAMRVPVYSVVGRRWYADGEDFSRALADCVTKPMHMREGLEQFAEHPPHRFVELGPGDMATRTTRSVLRGATTVAPLARDTGWMADLVGASAPTPH